MVMASKNAPAQGWRMVNVDLFVPFLQRQTRCPARVVVAAVALFIEVRCFGTASRALRDPPLSRYRALSSAF